MSYKFICYARLESDHSNLLVYHDGKSYRVRPAVSDTDFHRVPETFLSTSELYQHYKGGLYFKIGTYQNLTIYQSQVDFQVYVRPTSEFKTNFKKI